MGEPERIQLFFVESGLVHSSSSSSYTFIIIGAAFKGCGERGATHKAKLREGKERRRGGHKERELR